MRAVLVVCALALASPASARLKGEPPSAAGVKDCYARAVLANRAAKALAERGDWPGALAQVRAAGEPCPQAAAAMISEYDRLRSADGAYTGQKFYLGPFSERLPRYIALRIRPIVKPEVGTWWPEANRRERRPYY